ncbi:hypothetical protein MUU46_21055 [Scandinavium sp. TWS1a]|uniref:hypothetical protein n=1 Tax=Scandinavium tedordense TaxID=2926521 RepID=UPI0021657455|nr:hypothetical protein [Scandinavium tedordense]MCS2172777.1 hypothetical protein [Scandinavium tedordense]
MNMTIEQITAAYPNVAKLESQAGRELLAQVMGQLSALAAENAGLRSAAEFATAPDMWIEQADGMLDYRYCEWYVDVLNAAMTTPATDAFLAEVRASVIPEGYVLVPQQIFLDPSDIESICSQCGDGHESGYGDFTDGLLWVGNIQCDDGSIVHGLHISSADYTEEGGMTISEFDAELRQGAAL